MQRRFCNWIFAIAIAIIIIMVTPNGKGNDILGLSNAYESIRPPQTDSIFTNASESAGEKQTNQLDSSLSSFIDENKKIIVHIHPRLNITLNGKPFIVPNGIGINTTLWNDHSLDQYGMQPMKMTMGGTAMIMQGMAPLHTHDSTGIIHVESNEIRNFTLGEFFQIWGIDLHGKMVSLIVGGKPIDDFSNHVLTDKEHMILNIKDQKNVNSS